MLKLNLFVGAVLFVLAFNVISMTLGANILAIHPFPGPSQFIVVEPFLKALAARGHNLTVVSAFPQKEKVQNWHDIPVMEVRDYHKKLITTLMKEHSKWEDFNILSWFCSSVAHTVLKNAEVQRQLLREKPNFDLIIIEPWNLDPIYGFAERFNVPVVGISTFGADSTVDDLVDNSSPLSYVPSLSCEYSDYMNFWQRLNNIITDIVYRIHTQLVHIPRQIPIYKEYFPELTTDLRELRRNISLILVNQHFSLSFPRPYVPNIIEVGGFHVNYKPAPLPNEMEKFINESKNGVIYFSLGSNAQSKDLPQEKLDVFMRVFAKLPQRVMWKFEDPNLPGKPDNVFIAKWFPQSDILAHPNVKLFITHGGLISTIESIYHGKPVVGIPLFHDQFLNIERAKHNGYGDGLRMHLLNEEELVAVIKRLLENPSYTKVAQQMSIWNRDQPVSPMETAIFWTEYVIRHKGAGHMRVAAQRLNIVQRYSIDTLSVLLGSILLIIYVLLLTVRVFLALIFRKNSTKQKSL